MEDKISSRKIATNRNGNKYGRYSCNSISSHKNNNGLNTPIERNCQSRSKDKKQPQAVYKKPTLNMQPIVD